jgi:hypothetical protein
MQFNVAEVRFLRQEHAMHRLNPIQDLRELGCPAHIFQRILEQRAKKLGPDFERLRNDAAANATAPSSDDLSQRIQSSKLF